MTDQERVRADEALEEEEHKTWILWLALQKMQEVLARWKKQE